MKLLLNIQKATQHLKNIPTKKDFTSWIKAALKVANEHQFDKEVTIRLVDEAESAEFNEKYRHKKGPTNILSFSYESMPLSEPCYLGDLLICVPLVFQEAKEQNKSATVHWAHLTIHGILHLLGYDHMKKKEAAVMEELEIKILKQLGYKNLFTKIFF